MSSSNEAHHEQHNRPEQTPTTVFITSLLIAALSHALTAKAETKSSKPYVRGKAWPGGLKATSEVPDDPALPALATMRAAGAAGAIRAPGLGDGPIEFSLRSYSPGSRATFEACAGDRRVAVKAYAEDPSPEAELYEALAAAGLAGDSGVRVAPLLTWDRDLRVLVNGWLEGPTANQLVKCRQGRRAGALAPPRVQPR